MRVVAAPDSFKGTVGAVELASAIAEVVEARGGSCVQLPMADGGEGTLEALGGANRSTLVAGPLGDPVRAGWRLVRGDAVVEMAAASGLELVGGADGNDPMAASTTGTGELIAAALDAGARRILVGVGGSATTDGGLGALRSLSPLARLSRVELVVACDVRTRFVDAAEVFAPQKGATPSQVALLRRRLERLAQVYRDEHGVEVGDLVGGGAAGGLAGGLAAVGASLVPGVEVVAEHIGLEDALEGADLVVTGEGFVDDQSFEGKVVGGVAEIAGRLGVPVLVVAGAVYDGVEARIDAVSLTERFGADRAMSDPLGCVAEVVDERLSGGRGGGRRSS